MRIILFSRGFTVFQTALSCFVGYRPNPKVHFGSFSGSFWYPPPKPDPTCIQTLPLINFGLICMKVDRGMCVHSFLIFTIFTIFSISSRQLWLDFLRRLRSGQANPRSPSRRIHPPLPEGSGKPSRTKSPGKLKLSVKSATYPAVSSLLCNSVPERSPYNWTPNKLIGLYCYRTEKNWWKWRLENIAWWILIRETLKGFARNAALLFSAISELWPKLCYNASIEM